MMDEDAWRRELAEKQFGEKLTPGFARVPPRRRAEPSTNSAAPELPPVVAAPGVLPPLPVMTTHPLSPSAPLSEPPTVPEPAAVRRTWPRLRVLTGVSTVVAALAAGWLARGAGDHTIIYVPVRVAAGRPASPLPSTSTQVSHMTAAGSQQSTTMASTVPIRAILKRQGSEHGLPKAQFSPPEADHQAERKHIAAQPGWKRRANASAGMAEPEVRAGMGPSFECRRPVSEVTRAICGDRQLAALDRRLTERFSLLDRSVDPTTIQALHHGETTFLNARQSCADKACLVDNYRQRLRELERIKP